MATRTVLSRVASAGVWVVVLLALWWLAPRLSGSLERTIPTPREVAQQFGDDGWSFYWQLAWRTTRTAGEGWLIGTLGGVVLGLVTYPVAALRQAAVRLATVGYALPVVAIGPVVILLMDGPHAVVLLAALPALMLGLVGTLSGMDRARGPDLAMIRASGGGTWAQLVRCRLPYAAPAVISSMKIAAPTSFVSAVVGEFLVGRGGLGVALINSQQQFVVARVWCLTMVCAVVSASMYGVIVLLERWLTPWGKDVVRELDEPGGSGHGRDLRRSATQAIWALIVAAVLLGVWQWAVDRSVTASIVARSPRQLWEFFGPGSPDAAGRHEVFTALLVTLRHTAVGYLSGAALAVVLAVLVSMIPGVERGLLTLAIVVRTVPLVALTPLLIVLVGSGTKLVIAIGAVSTFFPTLVNLVTGLRLAPSSLVDVPAAAGAGRGQVLLRVRLPACLPYVFASAKIAVPTAVTGALLAEWFGTGDGLGYMFATGVSSLNFTPVWGGVVAITLSALLAYALLDAAEVAGRRRFGV